MPWATITQTLPARLHSTHTLCEAICGPAFVEEGADHLEQLAPVGGAALELEVDVHVGADRGRGLEGRDVLRARIDDRDEPLDVGEVAQRLDAARVAQAPIVTSAATGARISRIRSASCAVDDRALDDREVVGPLDLRRVASRK